MENWNISTELPPQAQSGAWGSTKAHPLRQTGTCTYPEARWRVTLDLGSSSSWGICFLLPWKKENGGNSGKKIIKTVKRQDQYRGNTDTVCSWSSRHGCRAVQPKFPDLEFVKEQDQTVWSTPVRNVLLKVNAFISVKSKNSNNEPCFKSSVGKHL